MPLAFFRRGEPVSLVCTKNHRSDATKAKCSKAHDIPADAQWYGVLSKEFIGDDLISIKECRKEYRKAIRRWEYQLRKLSSKRCAPAFADYLANEIKKHQDSHPVLKITLRDDIERGEHESA